jgi:hypothetical protein
MKHEIHITRQPVTDTEFIAAVIAILKVTAAENSAKVKAICALVPLSGANQFEAKRRGHKEEIPVIFGPEVPDPGFDKDWTLRWQDPFAPRPVKASPPPSGGNPPAPAAVPPPAPIQPAQPPVPPHDAPAEGILARLWRFFSGR